MAGPPTGDVDEPEVVRKAAAGHPTRAVWVNQLGGITFEVLDPSRPCFVKWSPPTAPDLAAEMSRLQWARRYAVVPEVLEHGSDPDGQWLVTAALPGDSAVFEPWRSRPATAARAIGAGLRRLHEQLPVNECPFTHWSAPERLSRLSAELPKPPGEDRLVVCHGDPCAPNTLIAPDGQPAGHVDLGALGVADRWADLAIASWSLAWNYGTGYEAELLDAYGVEADPERAAYYRLLWDLMT